MSNTEQVIATVTKAVWERPRLEASSPRQTGKDTPVIPEVGMGATYGIGSDCYPYTIVEVKSRTTILVRADDYQRTDNNGYGGHQEYDYYPNPEAGLETVTLRKNGRWVKKGYSMNSGCGNVYIGYRRAYYDPHR